MTAARGREVKHPIRAVSKLTGVSIDTLRAWERRYQAVTPARDDRGRLYSNSDIARVRLLNDAVMSGHTIGRVARLSDGELRRLMTTATLSATAPRPIASAHVELSDAIERFDGIAVDLELARLAAVLSPFDLVRNVLLPTLRDVGGEWNRRPGGIAREHLMSAATQHLLGSFLRLHARQEAGIRLMFATPSGDRHEIGILCAAMLAASRGFRVSYLGPDLPTDQILEASRAAGDVSVLVLGVTLFTRVVARELRAIARGLPRHLELWAGGPGAEHRRRLLSTRGLVLNDLDTFVEQLRRLDARQG